MEDPTKEELVWAHSVIEEIMGKPDELLYTAVDIDSYCGWQPDDAEPSCGEPITKACVLFDEEMAHVVAYCDHHAACMTEAARARRKERD